MTTIRIDYPELADLRPPQPVANWRNRDWQYIPAAAHGDSLAFAARQRERMEQAQRQREAA